MHTMKDVAAAAGVSVATVSNYLNNAKTVSAARGKRIADAIERLSYIPDQTAKNLKLNSTSDVGVILPDISDRYYAQILRGIESVLIENGLYVNLGISRDLPAIEEKYVYGFMRKKVAGLIMVTAQPDNTRLFENVIVKNKIPFVHIDRKIDAEGLSFAGYDNEKTIFNLTGRFLDGGKRHITIITGPGKYSAEADAVSGYMRAYASRNIEPDAGACLSISLSKESAFRAIVLHLQKQRPEVIITTSAEVTEGVLEGIALAGYRVPEDIITACLGEDNWNRLHGSRSLISTSRESIMLGKEAAGLLCSQIKKTDFKPQVRMFEDKFKIPQKSAVHRAKRRGKIKAAMLDTLQTDLFSGLIPHFQNAAGICVGIKKIPHRELLNYIYTRPEDIDIFMFDMPWLYPLAQNKIISDITCQIEESSFNTGIYLQNSLKYYGEFDGRYYGLPFMYAPQILFYRKDLFQDREIKNLYSEACGEKLQPPRTWTEFNRIARFFTRSENKDSPTEYGTAVSAAYEECLIPEILMRIKAYGGQIYNNAFKVVFYSGKTVKAYNSFFELINTSTPDCIKYNDMEIVDEFLNGSIAMLITYPSFVANINDLQKSCLIGKIDCAHIPGKSPVLGGWSLGISELSQKKEEAFSFIAWACSEDMANYSTIMAGQSAVAKTFDNNELISLYPWLPLYKDAYNYVETLLPPYLKGNPVIPPEDISGIISDGIYDVINKKIDIENAVLRTHRSLVDLFEGYGYAQ